MIRSPFRTFAALLLMSAAVLIPSRATASLESEIELLRSDIKTEKTEIVKEALDLSGAKADAFWPVYRKYQLELDAINDQRIAMIKDYAANFTTMTDVKAKELVNQALSLHSKRTDLLKKYYKNFEKVIGATDAAKLVQVEHLIQALGDVQVGASMPLIQKPATAKE